MSETNAIALYREITGSSEAEAKSAYMFLDLRRQNSPDATRYLQLEGLENAELLLSGNSASPKPNTSMNPNSEKKSRAEKAAI
ncbi:MAG TPA: hypothetical protein VGR78_06810 [Verrucomicrobiae bacterium]|jgi:hypothetical protein|nr:hypothetical protein [Verrucomicrobiae bacterium]